MLYVISGTPQAGPVAEWTGRDVTTATGGIIASLWAESLWRQFVVARMAHEEGTYMKSTEDKKFP